MTSVEKGEEVIMFEKSSLSLLQDFILGTQIHLLGLVRPQLRAVKVNIVGNKAVLWFYYDGEISQNDEKAADVVLPLFRKFTRACMFRSKYVRRWDYPRKIPEGGYYVYLRDESIFKNTELESKVPFSKVYFNGDCCSPFCDFRLLSAYALLGKVRPNLRAVKGEINEMENRIYLWFYFNGEMSAEDTKIATMVGETIVSIFGTNYSFESCSDRLDYPHEIPSIGGYIYKRDESIFGVEDIPTRATLIDVRRFEAGFPFNPPIEMSTCLLPPQAPSNRLARAWEFLLGEIRSNWRAIQLSGDDIQGKFYLRLYIDGEIKARDRSIFDALTVYMSHPAYKLDAHIERLDSPAKISSIGYYLFLREELPLHSSESEEATLTNDYFLHQKHLTLSPYADRGKHQKIALDYPTGTLKNEIVKMKMPEFIAWLKDEVNRTWRPDGTFNGHDSQQKGINTIVLGKKKDSDLKDPSAEDIGLLSYKGKSLKDKKAPLFLKTVRVIPHKDFASKALLRAVTLDSNEKEKKLYLLFYFHHNPSKLHLIKIEEIIQKAKIKCCPEYLLEGYMLPDNKYGPEYIYVYRGDRVQQDPYNKFLSMVRQRNKFLCAANVSICAKAKRKRKKAKWKRLCCYFAFMKLHVLHYLEKSVNICVP